MSRNESLVLLNLHKDAGDAMASGVHNPVSVRVTTTPESDHKQMTSPDDADAGSDSFYSALSGDDEVDTAVSGESGTLQLSTVQPVARPLCSVTTQASCARPSLADSSSAEELRTMATLWEGKQQLAHEIASKQVSGQSPMCGRAW